MAFEHEHRLEIAKISTKANCIIKAYQLQQIAMKVF